MSIHNGTYDEWYALVDSDRSTSKPLAALPGMPKRRPDALYVAATVASNFQIISESGDPTPCLFLLSAGQSGIYPMSPFAFVGGTAISGTFQIVCLWALESSDFGNRNAP